MLAFDFGKAKKEIILTGQVKDNLFFIMDFSLLSMYFAKHKTTCFAGGYQLLIAKNHLSVIIVVFKPLK